MNDQMFVETLTITSSLFATAVVLVLSVLLIERTGWLRSAAEIDQLWLRNAQIIRGFQNNRFIQRACVEGDFIKLFEE